MQEIVNEQPEPNGEPAVAQTEPNATESPRQTWREWLGTEEAVRWVYLIFGLLFIALIMTRLQYSTDAICCGDWDGYYHIRFSSLLWESFSSGKWLPTFEWLPLTVLNPQDYADHHFLFHLLQIPFLWLFEPVTAAKVGAIFFGTLAVFSVYWLMFRYGVTHLVVWLLAILTCANPFYYRMNMAKAPPLTIIFTVIGIYLLFERRYAWLAPLMFLFVWTYSLFPLLLFAAVIWAAVIGWNERRFEWRPIAYTAGGMVLGNIINPYFPNNLKLFWEHFATKFNVAGDFAVAVGGEWYPYSAQDILTHFPIALTAMLLGYILFTPKNGRLPEKSTFLLAFVTILIAAQFRSKRFAEYFPPFAILFAAFSWKDFFTPAVLALPPEFHREIEPLLDADKKTSREEFHETLKTAAVWVLAVVLSVVLFYNFVGIDMTRYDRTGWRDTVGIRTIFSIKQEGMIESIGSNEPDDKYRRATDWMKENIPPGERIFNCNWDDFPKLFYFDTMHSYVYGLDPNYLLSQNPELSRLIGEITSGKTEEAGPVIREKFGANYVFTDAKENEDMVVKLLDSGWAEMAYDDDEARILRIRTEKGQPASAVADEDAPPTPEELKELEELEKADNTVNASPKANDDNEDN